MGASAGGHLALMLGETNANRDDPAAIQAVIDFYGPTDLCALRNNEGAAGHAVNLLLGGKATDIAARCETASPLQLVGQGNPPVLIIHGTEDALVPLDQSRGIATALQNAGVRHRLVVVKGARHGFGLETPTRSLVPDIVEFLEQTWNGSGAGNRLPR